MTEKNWFLYIVDHHQGPYSIDEIKKFVKKGEAKSSSFVWREGLSDWIMMSESIDFGGRPTVMSKSYNNAPSHSSGSKQTDSHGASGFVLESKRSVTGRGNPKAMGASSDRGKPDASGVDPGASVWCILSHKEYSGPYSMKTIVRKIAEGEFSSKDTVWKDGWTNFVAISDIPEFVQHFLQQVDSKSLTNIGKKQKPALAPFPVAKKKSIRLPSFPIKKLFFLIILMGGLYHALTLGYLDPLLDKAGVKGQIKALQLPLISVGPIMPLIQKVANPKLLGMLPEPVRGWFMPVKLPENLSDDDQTKLISVAAAPVNNAQIGTAIPFGDEVMPSFVIASNLPDGAKLQVKLIGKGGTLLNSSAFEKSTQVTIEKRLGRTERFTNEQNKALPKGEYSLIIYEADNQLPVVQEFLSKANKRQPPEAVPAGKVAFVIDPYFLGGKKDKLYFERIKEQKERQQKEQAQPSQDSTELKQIGVTLENLANESATKFFTLSKHILSTKQKKDWADYSKKYKGILGQIGRFLQSKSKTEVIVKATNAAQLTETLHQMENDFIMSKKGSQNVIRQTAGKTMAALNDLRKTLEQ